MKKQVTVEQTFCDSCGEDAGYCTCLECGREFCFDCRRNEAIAIEYNHAVHFAGSDDGLYCAACDKKLRENGGNELHQAYLMIASLRNEEKGWYADFKKRADIAEAKIKSIISQREGR